uniref:Uncharacterized protein n=1 Tax=Cereibacter sphaeroides (strain ATCC 17025 / ATH 2.4.3) TaxID=349102 RepID=A4WVR3_CERS5
MGAGDTDPEGLDAWRLDSPKPFVTLNARSSHCLQLSSTSDSTALPVVRTARIRPRHGLVVGQRQRAVWFTNINLQRRSPCEGPLRRPSSEETPWQ